MEATVAVLLGVLVFCFALAVLASDPSIKLRQRKHVMPPGPRPWPVVGNIFQLGWSSASAPHRSFATLAKKHGAVMTLHLGSMQTVVISSCEAARVMFRHHDIALAGRKIYEAMKGDISNEWSLITAQYGPHWRMLRRMCTFELFATSRLDATRDVRAKCVHQLLQFIREESESCNGLDIGRYFFLMAFNLIGNMILSKDLLEPKSEQGAKFFFHAGKVMELSGRPNIADFFPLFKWIDPQGLRSQTQRHVKCAFDIAGEFIKERMRVLSDTNMEINGSRDDMDGKKRLRKDYLDVLLEYGEDGVEGPPVFTSQIINVVVLEMFIAGTDTTTSTLEWAMAELLHNPRALQLVQEELRTKVDPEKNLEEEDLEQLPYLKAVVKETLRLHPPLPFLVPHMAMDSCEMLGFSIPKETQILVNVWAIGRDPKTWIDPLEFKPERFLEPNTMDYKGHHFEFLPFGSGRRMCPGLPLASRVLPMALGSVLRSFNWILADDMKSSEMDMNERMGITLRKAVPLKVIPSRYADN